MALGVAALNPAESPQGRRPPADPYRSFTILEQRLDSLPLEFRVVRQLAVLPACKPAKVPIQRRPSRAASKRLTSVPGRCSPGGGCHGTARTPSNRSKPKSVPTQR